MTYDHLAICLYFGVFGCLGSKATTDKRLDRLARDFWDWSLVQFPARYDPLSPHVESFSLETFSRRLHECEEMLKRSETFVNLNLSRSDQLTLKLLRYQLQTFIDGYNWKDFGALNPVNNLEELHFTAITWVNRARYRTLSHFRQYVEKLRLVPRQIREIQTLMAKAVELQHTNYNESMTNVVDRISTMATVDPEQSVFYVTHLTERLDQCQDASDNVKSELRSKGLYAISKIQEEYRNLENYIREEYLRNTRAHPGIWSLDKSERGDYYRKLLKWHLSYDDEPANVMAEGEEETARITGEMEKIIRSLGHDGNVNKFFVRLKNTSCFSNHTSEEYVDLYKNALYKRIQPRLSQLFSDMSIIPNVTVRGIPDMTIMAAYEHPTVFVSMLNTEKRFNFTVMTIALHEGSPGHHLQISYMNQLQLPDFRRYFVAVRKNPAPFHFPYYTSYIEGWGLYAEYLGEELNLFTDPYELLGRYDFERFRAVRMVVDVGIHFFGWPRIRAVNYMKEHTVLSHEDIEAEVDRYITWPGQACAYKCGEMAFKRIRKKATNRLGDRFNIKTFHDVVLSTGPVPLDTLEDIVDAWVEEVLSSSATNLTHATTVLLSPLWTITLIFQAAL